MGAAREESALNMFRQMDLKGKAQNDTQLKTVHQNTIATIRAYGEASGAVRKFSSELTPNDSVIAMLTLTLFSKRSRRARRHLVCMKYRTWKH